MMVENGNPISLEVRTDIYDKLNIVLIPENATMSRNSRCNEQ
jgi:hypothetical protein